jgi:hypothetical protein
VLKYSTIFPITMPVQTRTQTRPQKINEQQLGSTDEPVIMAPDEPQLGSTDEQQLGSTDEPVIMAPDEPAAGKPPCYLAWGRFLTEKEYRASGGKTAEEVTKMMAKKPVAKGPRVQHGASVALDAVKTLGDVDHMTVAAFALGSVPKEENQDECQHFPHETTHGLAWNANVHYMSIGGQCGQSCGCCRADVYKSGQDEDAKWGACSICLST